MAQTETPQKIGCIRKLKLVFRWNDWALSKIPMLCTVGSYACLVGKQTSMAELWRFLLFTFVFATLSSSVGFLINDLSDRAIDRQVGKRNTFEVLGKTWASALLFVVVIAMVCSAVPFASNDGFIPLWIAWLALCTTYSLPPLRFKTRGAMGIVASSLSQCTLPILLASAALLPGSFLQVWPFIMIGTISGASLEFAHQRHDLANDRFTSTTTFAVRLGSRTIDKLYKWVLWLDRLSVGALVAVACFALLSVAPNEGSFPNDYLSLMPRLSGITLISIYVTALANIINRLRKGKQIDPYYGPRQFADRMLHDILPNLLVPAFLLARLSQESPIWLTALGCLSAWRFLIPAMRSDKKLS